MTRIAPIKTVRSNKALWFDAGDININVGQNVVVETARGTEYGTLVAEVFEATEKQLKNLKSDLKPVKRIANYKDIKQAEKMAKKSEDALPVFKKLAAETNEKMVPVYVEYLLDGKKAIFYFSAPERQDFRDLVKKLSSEFKLRVDMRQINEREQSAMVGGIGPCGQELCCARIGRCPKHVSIKMAKAQGLSLNPENISGMCGKLLCCLDYEFKDYDKFTKAAPKLKAKILTPEGEAIVTDINMLKEHVEVMLSDSDKRYKIPLKDFEIDKAFARKISGGNPSNIRPNRIKKDVWEQVKEQDSMFTFETVYTTTSLQGSEKLASGEVSVLPSLKRKEQDKQKSNNKPNRKNKKNRNRKKKRNNNQASKVNVYENSNNTTVRRRSRKIESGTVKPGQKSSGLRNNK